MTWLIYLFGAVAAACFYAAGYRRGQHRNTPIEAVADGFWRGYWIGHRDGTTAATAIERTPSPN